MLLSSAKLPGFVAVILCKEEFLILGVFFPCFVAPFVFILLAPRRWSEFLLFPSCLSLELPVYQPPVWTWGPLATSGPSMCRCCAGLLLFEAVLLYCSVSFHSDVYINNWMPLVGCNYTPGSYIHQFSSAFFFFFPSEVRRQLWESVLLF